MEQQQVISRIGHFTASEIGKLMKSGKSKDALFGETALTYIWEKASEVVTGERKKPARSASLDFGIEHEKDAFLTFKDKYGVGTYYGAENFKYFPHPEIELSGGSPDGETPDDVLEIKCPFNSSNHLMTLYNSKKENPHLWLKKYNLDYYCQMQWNMRCMGKESGLFISYDPRTVEYTHRLSVIHVPKDAELLTDLEARVKAAIGIVNDILKII